jgi:hypothetical protein
MMTLAIKNPKGGLVYCKRELVFDKLTPNVKDFIDNYSHLHTYWDHFQVVQGVLTGKTYLRDRELLNSPKNKIGEPTNVLLKKDCFKKLGYFSEVLRQALDSDYWYRVMKYYDVGFIDLKLVKFRLHDNQTSVLNKNKNIQDKELLYRSYYKELFWFLHLQNQLKLLKLYHPIVKRLVKIKQSFNA